MRLAIAHSSKDELSHYVILSGEPSEYDIMEDMYYWCTETFGKADHNVWGLGYTSFYFATLEQATLFILRWS